MTSIIDEHWSPPVSFRDSHLKVWSEGVFPDPFQKFIIELSRFTETPIELAALMVLPVVSTALQGCYEVKVKEGYCEPLSIWTCVAMAPGSRKSSVQMTCIEPLTEWEKGKRDEMMPLREKILSQNVTLEVKIKELRKRGGKLEEAEFSAIKEEIAELEQQIISVPALPQLWTSDITPENLAVLMSENCECMALLSDEAGIFEVFAGRYNKGVANLDLALQGHSGNPCRVNRSSQSPIFLQKPALSIGLTPQPHVLGELLNNPIFRGRGFSARFLFAVPVSNLGNRNLDEAPMDLMAVQNYHAAIKNLLKLGSHEHVEEQHKRLKFSLSSGAAEDWLNYARVIEIRMGEDGLYFHIRDWAGKLPGMIARIAGLLHGMRHYQDKPENYLISQKDMMAAIKIGGFVASHAEYAFAILCEDSCWEGSRRILNWIKKNHCFQFTQRDCHHGLKSYFKKVKELEPCLEMLLNHNYIKEKDREKVSHRPSRRFESNPYLFIEKEERETA